MTTEAAPPPSGSVVDLIGEPLSPGDPNPDDVVTGGEPKKQSIYKWLGRGLEYDPDKGLRAEDCEVPAAEYLKRFTVLSKDVAPGTPLAEADYGERRVHIPGMKPEHAFVPLDVQGVFLKPNDDQTWSPISIKDKGELQQFHLTPEGRTKLMVESDTFGDGDMFDTTSSAGFDSTQLIDTEFIPLMAGPFNKQLYMHDYLYMHARAFELVNHNAIAAAAVKILTRFTLGRGVSFHIKHDKARRVWDKFWTRNRMRERIRMMARDLTWQGEIMLEYIERRNVVDLRVLDPSTCWEVVTDPQDVDKVYYYHFQYPTPFQIWTTGGIPSSKYIVRQVPPTNIQHVRINCSATERRGRSDFMPAMPWFKRLGDYYNGVTVKAILEANLVWVLTIKGDLADLQTIGTDPSLLVLPPAGGIFLQNENVTLKPEAASLTGSRGASGIGDELIGLIMTSLNLPAEYANVGGGRGAAKATALVRTDPAVKTIEEKQQLLRETMEDMYVREMTAAVLRGELSLQDATEEPETGDDPDQMPDRDRDADDWTADRIVQGYVSRVRG